MDGNAEFTLENKTVPNFFEFLRNSKDDPLRHVINDRKDNQPWQLVDGQQTSGDLFKLALLAHKQTVNPTWMFTGRVKSHPEFDDCYREIMIFPHGRPEGLPDKLNPEQIDQICQTHKAVLGECLPEVFRLYQPYAAEFLNKETNEKEIDPIKLLCYESEPGAVIKAAEKYPDQKAVIKQLKSAVVFDFAMVPSEIDFSQATP